MKDKCLPIQILHPCQENIEKMQPNSNGWHCDKCAKQVHDVSELSDEEVLQLVSTGKACLRISSKRIQLPLKAASIAAGVLTTTAAFAQRAPIHSNSIQETPNTPSHATQIKGHVVDTAGVGIAQALVSINSLGLYVNTDSTGSFMLSVNNLPEKFILSIGGFPFYVSQHLDITNPHNPDEIIGLYIVLQPLVMEGETEIERTDNRDIYLLGFSVPTPTIDPKPNIDWDQVKK